MSGFALTFAWDSFWNVMPVFHVFCHYTHHCKAKEHTIFNFLPFCAGFCGAWKCDKI